MKRGTLIALGIGTVALVGVGAIALAGTAGTVGPGGVVWDKTKCLPTSVDTEALAKWFGENLRRLVTEKDITTGEQLVIAVMLELIPEECKDRFPPQEGTPEWDQWQLAIANYSDVYQSFVDSVLAEQQGAAMAWEVDPAVTFADTIAASFTR